MSAADPSLLRAAVVSALSVVKDAVEDPRADLGSAYADERPVLRLISPLVGPLDALIAATAVRQLGFELQCILPFDRSCLPPAGRSPHETDAESLLGPDTVVFELNGDRRSRQTQRQAEDAARRLVLDHCDVLLIVGGRRPAGGEGDIGRFIRRALEKEIPIIRIDPAPPHRAALLMPYEDHGLGEGRIELLRERLLELLRPPEPAEADDDPPRPDLRTAYFAESQPTHLPPHGWVWAFFRDLVGDGRLHRPSAAVPDFELVASEVWEREWAVAPALDRAVRTRIDARVRMHYAWADGLASYYGAIYRSSFVLNYLLAALVVFIAVTPVPPFGERLQWLLGWTGIGLTILFVGLILSLSLNGARWVWLAFTGLAAALVALPIVLHLHAAEVLDIAKLALSLVLLAVIIRVTMVGSRRRWHERWIDYRLLAEMLRQLRFLAPLGRAPELSMLPAHSGYGDPRRTWMDWHLRAITRDLGLVPARLTGEYLEAYRVLLRAGLLVGAGDVVGQIEYHRETARCFEVMNSRLHRAGLLLFALTALIPLVLLLLFIVAALPPISTGGLVTALVDAEGPQFSLLWLVPFEVFFPALGTALAAIRSQGEMERVARRSKAMRVRLLQIAGELQNPGVTSAAAALAALAASAAQAMIAENLDWRIVFQVRPLELPA